MYVILSLIYKMMIIYKRNIYIYSKKIFLSKAVGNGKMTVDFFKNDFGLTGRETITLLGAHTMGR